MRLVEEYITIPVPKIVEYNQDMVVLERIEDVDLEQVQDHLSPCQLEGIKLQLQEYIKQLWSIPSSKDFIVGGLSSTQAIIHFQSYIPCHESQG